MMHLHVTLAIHVMPAEAGISGPEDTALDAETPVFAGVTEEA